MCTHNAHTRCVETVSEVSRDPRAYVGSNNFFPDGVINKLTARCVGCGPEQRMNVSDVMWVNSDRPTERCNNNRFPARPPFSVERISLLAPSEKWKTESHYRGADYSGRQASN